MVQITRTRLVIAILSIAVPFIGGCKYEGQARASDRELVGTYETDFPNGKEHIQLNRDMSFVQTFVSPDQQIVVKGRWYHSNQFLGPTEVRLDGYCAIGNNWGEDPASSVKSGPVSCSALATELNLIVHRENGRISLARNESADWYYDRVQ